MQCCFERYSFQYMHLAGFLLTYVNSSLTMRIIEFILYFCSLCCSYNHSVGIIFFYYYYYLINFSILKFVYQVISTTFYNDQFMYTEKNIDWLTWYLYHYYIIRTSFLLLCSLHDKYQNKYWFDFKCISIFFYCISLL